MRLNQIVHSVRHGKNANSNKLTLILSAEFSFQVPQMCMENVRRGTTGMDDPRHI